MGSPLCATPIGDGKPDTVRPFGDVKGTGSALFKNWLVYGFR